MDTPNAKSKDTAGILLVLTGAIAVAAIPMALGVTIVRLLPVVGEPRDGFSWWSLFHFLWIYVAMYVVITVFERLSIRLFPGSAVSRALLEGVGVVLVLALMYLVFFNSFLGALMASLASFAMYYVAKPLILPKTDSLNE